MNLLSILKNKHKKELDASHLDQRTRRQLNMMIDERKIEALKTLSKQFTVPRNVIGEHIIEIGCFYITRIVDNEKKWAY